MKRKLCLVLALAMVLSMFASMSVFAYTKYAFDADAEPILYVDVQDWTEMAGDFGLENGEGLYAVNLMIDQNEGFIGLDVAVHFDSAKVLPYGVFATGQSLSTDSTQNGDIIDASAVVYTVADGGVCQGFRYSNLPTQKDNLMVVNGLKHQEGTEFKFTTVTAGTRYAEDEGIIVQYYVITDGSYAPTANDFPIELTQINGVSKATEDLTPNTTVVNPWSAGGAVVTKDITVAFNEGGVINVNGAAATSGDVFTVGEDETVAAEIVPAEGYYCSEYVLDGTTVANTAEGAIANLTVAESLTATFAVIPVLDPVIGQEAEVEGTYYAQIDNFENIGDLDYGFKLTVTRKVVNGLVIERPDEVYFCSVKGKAGANTLGQFGAIIEILNATECEYTVEAIIVAASN